MQISKLLNKRKIAGWGLGWRAFRGYRSTGKMTFAENEPIDLEKLRDFIFSKKAGYFNLVPGIWLEVHDIKVIDGRDTAFVYLYIKDLSFFSFNFPLTEDWKVHLRTILLYILPDFLFAHNQLLDCVKFLSEEWSTLAVHQPANKNTSLQKLRD